jgi:hypothetical protein
MLQACMGATFNYFEQHWSKLAMARPKLVTTSISKSVRGQVDGDSLLQEALARGIVNVSAAARILRPAVVSSMGHSVSEEAIITSLRRIKGAYRRGALGYLKVLARSSIEVRTDLAMMSVQVDPEASAKIKDIAFKNYDAFLQISSSPNAYTLVFERSLFGYLRGCFKEEEVMEARTELAAATAQNPSSGAYIALRTSARCRVTRADTNRAAAMTISTCCARWLPSQAMRMRLAPSDPTIAPSVLAA